MNEYTYKILKNLDSKLSILQLFKFLGELKNASIRPAIAPPHLSDGKEYDLPPVVIWEYISVTDESIKFITEIINSYKWQEEWSLVKVKTNKWMLFPKRVAEVQATQSFQYMDPAFRWLRTNDPEFGRQTNADLELFVKYFRSKLENYLKQKEDKNNGEKYSE